MTKPRLLVIGGSGYLGDWVVQLACAEWNVTATYFSHAVDKLGADWRQLDVRDEAAVASLVSEVRPQVVVHTASLNPDRGDDFEAVVELADLSYTGPLHVVGVQPLSRYEFGVRLLRFHGVDSSSVIPVPSPKGKLHPLDCSRARALLRTPLPGMDEVLDRERASAR